MKRILLLLSISSVLFFSSCSSDDDPQINPLVGTWSLDNYSLPDRPTGIGAWLTFSSNNNSLWGEVIYEIEFKEDFTYERELRFANG